MLKAEYSSLLPSPLSEGLQGLGPQTIEYVQQMHLPVFLGFSPLKTVYQAGYCILYKESGMILDNIHTHAC